MSSTWICSLRPDLALMVLTGEPTVLLAPDIVIKCKKLAIHSAACTSDSDRSECWKRIIQMGWHPEDMPEGSLVGWAKIEKVIRYDNNTFAADIDKHCYSSPHLQVFKEKSEWYDDVYGLYLQDVHILKDPIIAIGQDKTEGYWWEAENPFDEIALKRLFEIESIAIDSAR